MQRDSSCVSARQYHQRGCRIPRIVEAGTQISIRMLYLSC